MVASPDAASSQIHSLYNTTLAKTRFITIVRTNYQNRIITRNFVQHSSLITRDTLFTIVRCDGM